MNAQIITLCAPATQKSGAGIVSSTKMMAANGQSSTDESLASQQKTDNNGDQVNSKTNKRHGHNFNDTLRKKMASETCEHAQTGNNDRQQKAEKKDKPDVTVQDVPNPAVAMNDTLEIERVTLSTDDRLSPQVPADTPPLEPANASPVEIIANISHSEAAISPANDKPVAPATVTTEISSVTFQEATSGDITRPETLLPVSQSHDARQVSPQNEQNPVESTQQIPAADTDQQEQFSEKALGGNRHSPSDAKPSTETDVITTPVTGQPTATPQKNDVLGTQRPGEPMENPKEIDILNTQRPNEPLGDRTSLYLNKKPVLPPQENPVLPVEKQEKTAQADRAPQSNLETEVHSAQTSVHKMNVAIEQINSLKEEKHENLAEKKDFNTVLDILEKVSADTTQSSSMVEKSPVSSDPLKIVGDTGSKLGLGRQIQESVVSTYRPGTQQIVIRLDPPDLGRVTIRFIEHRDGITGILHVDKSDTKHEIQQTLAGIVQNLQNANVPIKKLEVVLNNQPQNNGPGEDSGNHNGNFEQRHSFNQNASENTASYREWRANSIKISNSTDEKNELTDISINLLI
jgi:hypothetical protein